MIEIIAVVADNMAIGRRGDLLRHLSEDLRRFKQLTTGAAVVMGRKTWESLPRRPLPGRRNIVITRNAAYHPADAKGNPATAETALSLTNALRMAEHDEKIFIIGGGQIYTQALPLADTMHLTRLHESPDDADTWFPVWDPDEWQLIDTIPGTPAPGQPPYDFQTLRRI